MAISGILELPKVPVGDTEVIQGYAFALTIASFLADLQCVPVAVDSFLEFLRPTIDDAEIIEGPALGHSVAGLPEDREVLLQVADGLVKPSQLPVGVAEVTCPDIQLAINPSGLTLGSEQRAKPVNKFSNRPEVLWNGVAFDEPSFKVLANEGLNCAPRVIRYPTSRRKIQICRSDVYE